MRRVRLVFLAFAAAAAALAAEPVLSPPIGQLTTPGWSYVELRRFPAPEARQGVAVDGDFFFAIGNHVIGKYRKSTGERVAVWDGGEGGEVIHFNAGIVRNGRRNIRYSPAGRVVRAAGFFCILIYRCNSRNSRSV